MRAEPELLSQLFEGAPAFVDRLRKLDLDSWDELFERAHEIALSMPEAEQIALLNSHPRIGARPGTVSALSFAEQGYDRDPGTALLQESLDLLNDEYERHFGFRFVLFVDGRSRAEIADVMEVRLGASRTDELHRGLADVVAIARDRLRKLQPAHQEAAQ
jgi:2-oxo-4-hydroxy-4-carboxy--5-ureidoimidazoline (OHCU) decarboxylase